MVDSIRCMGNEKEIYLTGSGREGGREHIHMGSNRGKEGRDSELITRRAIV